MVVVVDVTVVVEAVVVIDVVDVIKSVVSVIEVIDDAVVAATVESMGCIAKDPTSKAEKINIFIPNLRKVFCTI